MYRQANIWNATRVMLGCPRNRATTMATMKYVLAFSLESGYLERVGGAMTPVGFAVVLVCMYVSMYVHVTVR